MEASPFTMLEKPKRPEPALSDDEIVRLLQRRKPEGLRQIIRNYGAKVRWYLRNEFRGALNEIEIDEAINEAVHRVWRWSTNYDDSRGTLRAWFYMISRSCAQSVLRREARQRRHTEVEDWDHTTILAAQPSRQPPSPIHRKFIDDLHSCIDKLTPLQMSIIKADLRTGNVADAGDLAQTLQTTKNSIYASRSIARKKLKQQLIKLGHSISGKPEP